MSERIVYKSRSKVRIYTKQNVTYETTTMWKYHYGIPKLAENVTSYKTFKHCLDEIKLKDRCWPDIFVDHTVFRQRPYIAVCDGCDWESASTRIFEKDFLYADYIIETVVADNISLDYLLDALNYKDFITFAKDYNITINHSINLD